MKAVRTPHLRTLNRFDLRLPFVNGINSMAIVLKPRGFETNLVSITIDCKDSGARQDAEEFFRAVRSLADTPAPTPKTRKKGRRR